MGDEERVKEERDIEKLIDTYIARLKSTKKILWTRSYAHNDAYNAGIKAIEGDLNKLKDDNIIRDVAKEMKETYLKHAKKQGFKFDAPEGMSDEEKKHYEDIMMRDYAGFTEEELINYLKSLADTDSLEEFSINNYLDATKDHTKSIEKKLARNSSSHIREEDKEEIFKFLEDKPEHTGIEKLEPQYKTLDTALQMVQYHDKKIPITEKFIEDYHEQQLKAREGLKNK
ncbi:hypothetical protein JXB31_04040 [Candidatus Woesearchaeota archaeon]|nr:hypothetical protein [Candidatus Woesearchaeota archaeon]